MEMRVRNVPKSLGEKINRYQKENNIETKNEAVIQILTQFLDDSRKRNYYEQLLDTYNVAKEVLERNQEVMEILIENIKIIAEKRGV